jgi:hypothetical protein
MLSLPCFGQMFEAGIKGGVPFAQAFETGSFFTIGFGEAASSAPRRYTVGPMAEVRLPHGFGIEADVLYKRLGFDALTKSAGVFFQQTRTSANSWEFPLLGNFRLHRVLGLKPYVECGPSFRSTSGVSVSTTFIFDGTVTGTSTGSNDSHLNNRSPYGVTAGEGFEFRYRSLHVVPEIGYTRWKADSMLDSELYSNQNQVDFLLSLAF